MVASKLSEHSSPASRYSRWRTFSVSCKHIRHDEFGLNLRGSGVVHRASVLENKSPGSMSTLVISRPTNSNHLTLFALKKDRSVYCHYVSQSILYEYMWHSP